MKAIFLIALIIASTYAVGVHQVSLAQQKRIETLMANKQWAGFMLNLAELHMAADGPLDQLISAINDVITDLGTKLEKTDSDFQDRTGQHNNEEKRLNREIGNAASDIANTQQFLSDVLYVQKANLEEDITNFNTQIENTNRYIQFATDERNKQNAEYLVKVEDHNGALSAIDECLQLIGGLITGEVSLAEVKKAKIALAHVQKKLGNTIESTFAKALLALTASTEFADTKGLEKVAGLLHNVRDNLEESLNKLNADEQEALDNYNKDMTEKNGDIARYQMEIGERKQTLIRTIEQIEQNEQFLASRQQDLISFNKELDFENESFDRATKAYEDLVAEFNKELEACQEAVELLNSAEFAGYIGNRMGQQHVADVAKGSTGVSVN